MKKLSTLHSKLSSKWALFVEIILTICILFVSVPITISSLTNEVKQYSDEVNAEYNTIIDKYITTFNMLTGQIKEKLKENPSFDELQLWMQSKEDGFVNQIGADIYDGIALTYKGGYAHSWSYGNYENYDAKTRPWYQQAAAANGKVTVVAPYVTYLDPEYFDGDDYILMTIAQRYNDEISFDYDIKLADIKKILANRKLRYNGSIVLYDSKGYILSSSNKDLYAHNINRSDSAITESLKNSLIKSRNKKQNLTVASINGNLKLLYSTEDSTGNTLCLLYSLWAVVASNFGFLFLIAGLLILFEIWLFRKNRKINEVLIKRDLRMTQIIDASYDEKLFVDMESLTFYGNNNATKSLRTNDYNKLYEILCSLAEDNDTKERLESYLSPKALKAEVNKEGFSSQKFNIVRSLSNENQTFVYEISRMITQSDDKVVVGIFAKDVTEDAEILRTALHDARQASVAKGKFLAQMSHEIRTPMNAIIGEATLAQYDIQNTQKVTQCLNKVMITSKHLLGLINDILDMSAIESNKVTIANIEFNIKDVISTITTLYYSQCKSVGISFTVKLENIKFEILKGDQLRLSQIILNLLSNAVKFTDKGGKVEFSFKEQQLSEHKVGLHITVEDTGCGMNEEYLKRIFKPFEQETELTAKEHGGSGLGLSITKNLAELMDGSISVSSKQGVGTKFTVDLPCDVSDNQVTYDKSMTENLRAIIVDDDIASLEYASSVLNHIGIVNTCVQSGEEAISVITEERNNNTMYDLCLIDWKMKDLAGIEFSKKIRTACGEKTIRIIASAYDLNEIQNEIKEAKIDACISKPLFQSTLFDTIMSLSQGKLVRDSSSSKRYDFSGKRVLVVDDNSTNREVAKGFLSRVGFEVDTLKNGAECVEVFKKSKPGTYQAIFMDVQMPEMNGYDATRTIRESRHPQAESIAIIAMTANAFAEDISDSLASGMNDHISKPLDPGLLYEIISKYL